MPHLARHHIRGKGDNVLSASKRKGTRAETAVIAALHAMGFVHAERRALSGAADRGDVAGIPAVCIEVKDCARTELSVWLDEALAEGANAAAPWPAVVHKRRGRADARRWFVTMEFEVWGDMLAAALQDGGTDE
jgi:hypothetical protein